MNSTLISVIPSLTTGRGLSWRARGATGFWRDRRDRKIEATHQESFGKRMQLNG